MKNFYFVRAITTVAVFAFTALRVFAQPAGANISNPIYAGTLSPEIPFSETPGIILPLTARAMIWTSPVMISIINLP